MYQLYSVPIEAEVCGTWNELPIIFQRRSFGIMERVTRFSSKLVWSWRVVMFSLKAGLRFMASATLQEPIEAVERIIEWPERQSAMNTDMRFTQSMDGNPNGRETYSWARWNSSLRSEAHDR